MKSHDFHIFMERLLRAAFCGFLPESIWVTLAELSFFYRQLCAKEISKETISRLEQNIPVLICKLENIFPPVFFNAMQHLMVRLPSEARLGGPVQHRWMHPFERFINKVKKKVGNKARVEGSIVKAYLIEESTNFLSILGQQQGLVKMRPLDMMIADTLVLKGLVIYQIEYKAAYLYIMSNISEMDDFLKRFELEEWKGRMRPTQKQIDDLRLHGWKGGHGTNRGPNFFDWFKNLCKGPSNADNALRQMSYGFRRRVISYECYDMMNGYMFRSEKYWEYKSRIVHYQYRCLCE